MSVCLSVWLMCFKENWSQGGGDLVSSKIGALSRPFVNLSVLLQWLRINDPEPGELIINIAKGRVSKSKRGGLITWRGEWMEIGSNSTVPLKCCSEEPRVLLLFWWRGESFWATSSLSPLPRKIPDSEDWMCPPWMFSFWGQWGKVKDI